MSLLDNYIPPTLHSLDTTFIICFQMSSLYFG